VQIYFFLGVFYFHWLMLVLQPYILILGRACKFRQECLTLFHFWGIIMNLLFYDNFDFDWSEHRLDREVSSKSLRLHVEHTVKKFHVKSLLSLLATVCSVVLTENSQKKSIKSHTEPIQIQIFLFVNSLL
jgi:hypothetical protein